MPETAAGEFRTVTIVGVGLIGGSFALALRQAGFPGRILGVSSPETLREAERRGVIDAVVSREEALAQADLIYLSHTIGRILAELPEVDALAHPGALITDAGSTKARIVERARETVSRAQFLGGHPMAGKTDRGVGAAEADLFRGSTYFLTPLQASDTGTPAARCLLQWIQRIGASPLVTSPDEHDRLVSLSSHLPQLAATALAALLEEARDGLPVERAAGPGLRGATRLALSSYEIWADILATNPAWIRRSLDQYVAKIVEFRENLASEEMRKEFQSACNFAARLRNDHQEA